MVENASVINILSTVMSNPNLTLAILIQILLGFALGYIMIKMAKYIIAFIGILIIGALLNVWSLGLSIENLLSNFGSEALKMKDLIMSLITTLGILTVGPVTLGFILGLVIGLMKK